MAEEKRYTPLLPFNDLIQDGFIIYDNTTYNRDIDLTDDAIKVKNSPNIVKYFTVKSEQAIKIGGD